MTRLTERERSMIQRAKRQSWERAADPQEFQRLVSQARAAQGAAIRVALSGGFSRLARYSGLADLAYLVKTGVIDRLRRASCYRRTLDELRHLDPHRLSDIGMTHDDVERYAWQAAMMQYPKSQSAPWLLTRIRFHFRRQALIHQLARLDDRALRDIGIERSNIVATVDRMLADKAPAEAAPAPAAALPTVLRPGAVEVLTEAAAERSGYDLFNLDTARRAA